MILLAVIILNRDHKFFWIIFSLLVLLQLYQLSEFLICIGVDENITGRIAYVIITFLPPLGYYLCAKVVGWKIPDYWIGFALATGFSLYYLSVPQSVRLVNCNPLYAIYSFDLSIYYGIYYIGLILYSIIFLLGHLIWRKDRIDNKKIILLLVGYLSFLAPMYLMIYIEFSFAKATTSIMCKYALLLAITLGIFSFLKPTRVLVEKSG